jgi:hypothetical protein
MKYIIRDDIINPVSYLYAEMKYKSFLTALYVCGGYALHQQVQEFFKDSDFKDTYYLIKEMQKYNLIGVEKLNKNKYVYIKSNAIKYVLYHRVDKLPEKLKIKRINKVPNRYGFYSFEYFLQFKKIINCDISKKTLKIVFEKILELLQKDRFENLDFVRIENIEYQKKILTKIDMLGYKSCLFLVGFSHNNFIKSSTLHFTLYDTGFNSLDTKFINKTVKKIDDFIGAINENFCKYDLEIITFSDQRKNSIQNLHEYKNISYKVLYNMERYLEGTTDGIEFTDRETIKEKLEE